MAGDAELDRLKAAQDLAFQRKQAAYQTMDAAWKRCSAARDALDRAHDAKQRAYDVQNAAWEYYQSVRSSNGPRIDSFNDQQERAFNNMRSAFDNASAAHNRRDGASARSYADDGHRYKQEAQDYVAERRRLVQEIRDARDRHDATKPAFGHAKSQFDSAKRDHYKARDEHQRTQEEFKRAKAEFDSAVAAFKRRLEQVRAESKRRQDDKRSIAQRARVPYQYLDNVWVSRQSDGSYNIYFGGMGEPNGPGHGHYVMDASGNVTYRRDPFDPHGAQNFTDAQQDYHDVIGAEVARGGEFGFRCRFRGYDALVESSFSRDGQPKIDIYYGPNGPLGPGHHHAVARRDTPHDFFEDRLRG